MIEFKSGNLLQADVEALINTVNTVGVMGKGIALQFKQAFPENFTAYERAAKRGAIIPGQMFVHETGQFANPRYIINFPTKRHWRGKARLDDMKRACAIWCASFARKTSSPLPSRRWAAVLAGWIRMRSAP